MKKGQRVTTQRLAYEISKMRQILPAWYRDSGLITSLEIAVGNYEHAIIATTESFKDRHNLTTHGLKLLLWLYQFEFFEKEFAVQNYKTSHAHYLKDGTRHAALKFKELTDNGLIVHFQYRGYTFYEEDMSGLSVINDEKKSNNTYQLSDDAIGIIGVFYNALTGAKPKIYGRDKKILRYEDQVKAQFNNINGGWDDILRSI